MKQNRRVIYLSDEEWAKAKSRAGKGTVSGVFREALRQLRTPSEYLTVQEAKAAVLSDVRAVVTDSPDGVQTSFVAYRPAPKPPRKSK